MKTVSPPAHEVFEGNIADTKTLRRIPARLALPEAGLKPVVILDAGFASKENLTLLRELSYSYLTLSRAEEGFGALKGSLGLRPNFHQLEERVEGHIFISILAYHLLCLLLCPATSLRVFKGGCPCGVALVCTPSRRRGFRLLLWNPSCL